MSLLPNLKNAGNRQQLEPQSVGSKKPPFLLHPEKIVDITRSVLADRTLSAEKRAEAIKGKYRCREKTAISPLHSLLGHVTAERWAAMTNAAIDGMRKAILLSQANGSWEIIDAECDIVKNPQDEDVLAIGCRWVDVLNQEDLAYANGKAAMNVNVKSQIDPSLLEMLQAKSHANSDPALADALKQLAAAIGTIQKNQFAED